MHYGITLLFMKVVISGHHDKANDKDNIEPSANTNTLKSEMLLSNNYEVDFRQYNSINSLV